MAKMIRQKREMLPSWTDKLNAVNRMVSREDVTFRDEDYEYSVIHWHCLVNMFGDLCRKTLTSITVKPLKERKKVSLLLTDSQFGVFCPHCLTNEYLSSTNDFRTGSTKLANPGKWCKMCHRETLW